MSIFTTNINKEAYLSIILPAYKEEAKIHLDIKSAAAYAKKRGFTSEIIVVDDGSPDNTTDVAKALYKDIPSLRVISYKPNRGKGYAIRRGIEASSGKYVMFADAGLCVPYSYADLGLDKLANGSDIAIGSRRYPGAEIIKEQPLYRRAGSKVFWLIVKNWLALPKNVTDTQCGFKLFKGKVARKLYSECAIDGFMIDIDMLCRANKEGYKISEFPVSWRNDADTHYNPVIGTLRNFSELWRIWWSRILNKNSNEKH